MRRLHATRFARALLCAVGLAWASLAHAGEPSASAALDAALAKPRGPAVAAVAELLAQGQEDAVTDRALEALSRLGGPFDARTREWLELYTHHRRVGARARAYLALSHARDANAAAMLERGLGDAAPEVRAVCARGLVTLAAHGALPTLLRALEAGVGEAAGAIGALADDASVTAYSALLGKVPLADMLSGYEAMLRRADLALETKLGIVARLEDLGGEVVWSTFDRLRRDPSWKAPRPLISALATSAARLDPHSLHAPRKTTR